MRYIDLNSDVGEGFGGYRSFEAEELYNIITSANIACGYHAGDPMIMENTIRLCIDNNVGIGAHPGLPDILGFGRRNMNISKEEAANYSLYQLGALSGFSRVSGKKVNHFKLHGAFYNMVMNDYDLSISIINKVRAFDENIIFLGLSNSKFIEVCKQEGLRFANEVFADRAYDNSGQLVSRTKEGAIIKDKKQSLEQVKRIVLYGEVKTIEGNTIKLDADSICVHGDNEKAIDFTYSIRNELEKEGVKFESLNNFIGGMKEC